MNGTVGGAGKDPGRTPRSVPVRWIDQISLYAIEAVQSVFPGSRVWVVTTEDEIGPDVGLAGTGLHEAVENHARTERGRTIHCAFCGDRLQVPPHGDREDAMRPHLKNGCRGMAG